MWRLKHANSIDARLVTIVANYEVLLEHDLPVLFTGTTTLGTRVLASSVDEDLASRTDRFLYSLVDDVTYSKLVNRSISYRQALESATGLFIGDRNSHSSEIAFSSITFDQIPERYRPTQDSFLPEFEAPPLAEYSLTLKGQLADTNAAEPDVVAKLQKKGATLLHDAFAGLRNLIEAPKILLQTATSGSFNINYRVVFEAAQSDLFQVDREKDSLRFANEHLSYCLNKLPSQAQDWINSESSGFPADQRLVNRFLDLHVIREEGYRKQLESLLIKTMRDTVRDLAQLSEEVGEGYNYITLAHKTESEAAHPLGVVDATYQKEIERIENLFEERFEAETETDSEPCEYKIQIYHLNTDSRSGNALIYDVGSSDELSKPKIKISGEEPLANSKYTASLYRDKFISIRGKATRQGKKFRAIDIQFA